MRVGSRAAPNPSASIVYADPLTPGRTEPKPWAHPRFLFLLKTQNPYEFITKAARDGAPSSTSVAIHGVPAGGPRHRRRRCATRTNEGTLKGTLLRLFFAADGPPADGAGTPRHAALASKTGRARHEFQHQLGTKGASSPAPLGAFSRRFTTLARVQPAASVGAPNQCAPRRYAKRARCFRLRLAGSAGCIPASLRYATAPMFESSFAPPGRANVYNR